jgi:hypothetical protein
MLRSLKSLTFIYDLREDRVAAAVNAGHPDSWSCWLTRRLSLALLERASEYVTSTSDLAQRAPADLRGDLVTFEREAAMAKTAGAMSTTPPEILKSSTSSAELAERVSISRHGDGFRLELLGQSENGAAGVFSRAELQRTLQMLQIVVTKAGWLGTPAKPQAVPAIATPVPKPARH